MMIIYTQLLNTHLTILHNMKLRVISTPIVYSASRFPLRFWAWANLKKKKSKLWEFLCQNNSFMVSISSITKKKLLFLHIFTKSVELIFQSAEPILQHTALEGTMLSLIYKKTLCKVAPFQLQLQRSCSESKNTGHWMTPLSALNSWYDGYVSQ